MLYFYKQAYTVKHGQVPSCDVIFRWEIFLQAWRWQETWSVKQLPFLKWIVLLFYCWLMRRAIICYCVSREPIRRVRYNEFLTYCTLRNILNFCVFVTEWHSSGRPSWFQVLSVFPARESFESTWKSSLLTSWWIA